MTARDSEIQNLQVTTLALSCAVSVQLFICKCPSFSIKSFLCTRCKTLLSALSVSKEHPVQAALGELAYSSEAVERLRTDLRAAATKLRHAEEEMAAVRKDQADADAAGQTLEAELTVMRQEQQKRSEFEARLSVSIASNTR